MFYTITHPAHLVYCDLQLGMQNYGGVASTNSGSSVVGVMTEFLVPFSRFQTRECTLSLCTRVDTCDRVKHSHTARTV